MFWNIRINIRIILTTERMDTITPFSSILLCDAPKVFVFIELQLSSSTWFVSEAIWSLCTMYIIKLIMRKSRITVYQICWPIHSVCHQNTFRPNKSIYRINNQTCSDNKIKSIYKRCRWIKQINSCSKDMSKIFTLKTYDLQPSPYCLQKRNWITW